jgi:hypothetical protein
MANQTTRRGCLRLTTAAASVSAIEFSRALRTGNSIALIVDPGSAVTTQEPVEWARGAVPSSTHSKGHYFLHYWQRIYCHCVPYYVVMPAK